MGRMIRATTCFAFFGVLATMVSCASPNSKHMADGAAAPQSLTGDQLPSLADNTTRSYPGLTNVVAYHKNFYSGSAPEGDEGFETLARMGIKTIISVDGAVPDVRAAHAHGMHYIHLPIGYNGFDEPRRVELARAAHDALEAGPVYIHCHHGKHRSAGAAGTIGASLGWASADDMVARMKISGTSPAYKGLYACTAGATVIALSQLDAIEADFPEVSRPVGLTKSMVEIDEINEHLLAIQKAQWTVPIDHPDLVPVAEAGRMADIFRVLCESHEIKSRPAEFLEMLRANSSDVQDLEDMIGSGTATPTALADQFALIQANCTACHAKYRN